LDRAPAVRYQLGDIIEDGDICDDSVNIAARLETLTEPGGICVSATAYDQVCYDDLGEQRVKNIVRAVRAYSVGSRPSGLYTRSRGRKARRRSGGASKAGGPIRRISAERA